MSSAPGQRACPAFLAAVLAAATFACTPGEVGGGGDGGDRADSGVPGADADPDAPAEAIVAGDLRSLAGTSVLLDGAGSVGDALRWEQVDGPTVTLDGADGTRARFELDAGAAPGTVLRFRLTAERGDDSDSAEVAVEVIDASFEQFVGPGAIGRNEGAAFDDAGLWIFGQDELAQFDPSGARSRTVDLPGGAAGMNFGPDGNLVVARNALGRVDALDLATGTATPLVADVGNANYPLVDADGNVYVSTRAGQTVLRFDRAAGTTSTFVSSPAIENPNALAFGPEPDVLYVGDVTGVWRVPIGAGGEPGEPSLYVQTGSEVDGLAFDVSGNLYIGCPNSSTFHVAPYRGGEPTTTTRSFTDVGQDVSYFINPVFGRGDFGATTLYYTNLGLATVGRVDIGQPPLVPPLAP